MCEKNWILYWHEKSQDLPPHTHTFSLINWLVCDKENNSLWEDIASLWHINDWFLAGQFLFLLLNAACLAEKQLDTIM